MSDSSFHEETETLAMGEIAKNDKPDKIDDREDGNESHNEETKRDSKSTDIVKTIHDATIMDKLPIKDEQKNERKSKIYAKKNMETGENDGLVTLEPAVRTVSAIVEKVEEEYEPTLAELAGIHLDGKDEKQPSQDECLKNWMARRLREEN